MSGSAKPSTRMIISKIVCKNFKSYAGVREIGPLHKNFSSIVGPNGSGKSNVIDALLFVLGRRATQIRQKKLAELIHNSSQHKGLPSCRVEVHFVDIVDFDEQSDEVLAAEQSAAAAASIGADDEESENEASVDNGALGGGAAGRNYREVPGSELVIARTANRKSQSKYYINDKAATFTEVADKLSSKGVDLDNNRFLILQGEVEKISLMSPMDLLEYLGTLIGSYKYTEPIEEAAVEVETLNEQRQTKLNRVKAVEKEKDALEDAKTEAEAFLTREQELHARQSELYQLGMAECEKELNGLRERSEGLEAQLETERAKVSEQGEQVGELEASWTRLSQEQEKLNAEMEKAKKDFAGYERQDIKYRESLKHEKNKIKKFKASITRAEKRLAQLGEEREALEAKEPELAEERTRLDGERAEAQEKLDEMFAQLRDETSDLREEMEAKQTQLIPMRTRVNEVAREVEVCKKELDIYAGKAEAQQKELAAAQEELAGAEERHTAASAELKESNKTLKSAQKALPKAEKRLAAAREAETEAGTRRQQLRASVEEGRSQLAASQSRGTVLSALYKAKRQGLLRGVQGRLGDLGAIDAKYDVAVSTACPRLDSVVVDTTETGQACVEFLRTNQLGRANFILMDKMQYLEQAMERELETPENVPRLFDLIEPADDSYRTAFYYALRDTLVAEDLDQAVRIAYGGKGKGRKQSAQKKRWRVVTLQGQLIDSSGTMSGGGNRAKRGGMPSSLDKARSGKRGAKKSASAAGGLEDGVVDAAQVKQMEASLAKAEKDFAAARKERELLELEVRKLSDIIATHEVRVAKLEMEIQDCKQRATDAQKRIDQATEALESQSSEDEDAVAELKEKLVEHEQALEEAKGEASQLESEVAELQQAIMDAGGAELRKQKARVEELTAQWEAAKTAVTKATVDINSLGKKMDQTGKTLAKAQTELEEAEARVEKLVEDFKETEEEAVSVMQAFEACKEQVEAKEEELTGIKQQYEEMKAVLDKARGAEVDIANQLDDLRSRASEVKRQYSGWKAKLRATQAKMEEAQRIIAAMSPSVLGEQQEQQQQDDDDEDEAKREDEADDEAAPAKPEARRSSRRTRRGKEEADESDDEEEQDAEDEEEEQQDSEQLVEDKVQAIKFRVLSEEELGALDRETLEYDITILEEELSKMRPNMAAIEEYRAKEREYVSRVEQLDKLTDARDSARRVYEGLRKRRLDEFMAGFSVITHKLKEMYQMLTLGGDAELELVDSLDPFSEGIVFSVRPPKKSWKNIQNLSGGEKTLSSLALVFALHHFKPTPFYVMDEIDAALDFKNVSIVANYIKSRTKNAQFVIISLRNNMFELADRLVGIYKTHDATKSITIDPKNFAVPVTLTE